MSENSEFALASTEVTQVKGLQKKGAVVSVQRILGVFNRAYSQDMDERLDVIPAPVFFGLLHKKARDKQESSLSQRVGSKLQLNGK